MNSNLKSVADLSDYKVAYLLLKSIKKRGLNALDPETYDKLCNIVETMNKRLQNGENPQL